MKANNFLKKRSAIQLYARRVFNISRQGKAAQKINPSPLSIPSFIKDASRFHEVNHTMNRSRKHNNISKWDDNARKSSRRHWYGDGISWDDYMDQSRSEVSTRNTNSQWCGQKMTYINGLLNYAQVGSKNPYYTKGFPRQMNVIL